MLGQSLDAAGTAPNDGEPIRFRHSLHLPQVSAPDNAKKLTPLPQPDGHFGPMDFGQKVKLARAEVMLSQRALADLLEVSPGLIGAWEGSQGKQPGREVLIRLARATGKPMSYFTDENVSIDPAVLETRVPEEIRLVKLFRRMSPKQRETHLALFEQSVAIRPVAKPKRDNPQR